MFNYLSEKKQLMTAGKITILTSVFGLVVVSMVFLFNAGKTELLKVEAQSATTTLTVLNTPPQWQTLAYETNESSTSTPTNSGQNVSWTAVADNSGSAPYFLLICSNSATPTPNAAASLNDLGTAPPDCDGTATQWAVSTATAALSTAVAATTTTESFSESNNWYAWVCDDDPVNPRCNDTYSQGLNATNSSPFLVNHRPVFSSFYNNSPADPGSIFSFFSTSSDPDTVDSSDQIYLVVCNANDFGTGTSTVDCGAGGTISSTTIAMHDNATTSYTLPSIIQDDVYDAWGFIVDEHGHQAQGGAHGTNVGFTVNNVAPTVPAGTVSINGGSDITLSVDSGETTGFTLDFETSDANSCENALSGDEMVSYEVALFRNSIGTSTCDGTTGSYNPNNCYPSSLATTTWNLSCTASSTSCGGPTDATISWSCTFPLWFVAQPTDSTSPYDTDVWIAAISGIDDNNATGTKVLSSNTVELLSFPAIDLLTAEIPYGALEPGNNTGTLNATTTVRSVGNTGLNENIEGEAMCTTFAVGNECENSATSTIPDFKQEFATSSVSYGSGIDMSSSSPQMLELKVPKTTSTSTPNSGITYWGIEVPATITLAGSYTGLNTFYAVISSSTDW
ncbi:MAG: hypothetical protein R3B60_03595 [Candidatus Paceibacterota bacterium]